MSPTIGGKVHDGDNDDPMVNCCDSKLSHLLILVYFHLQRVRRTEDGEILSEGSDEDGRDGEPRTKKRGRRSPSPEELDEEGNVIVKPAGAKKRKPPR